jgi:hypothetical protein
MIVRLALRSLLLLSNVRAEGFIPARRNQALPAEGTVVGAVCGVLETYLSGAALIRQVALSLQNCRNEGQ